MDLEHKEIFHKDHQSTRRYTYMKKYLCQGSVVSGLSSEPWFIIPACCKYPWNENIITTIETRCCFTVCSGLSRNNKFILIYDAIIGLLRNITYWTIT